MAKKKSFKSLPKRAKRAAFAKMGASGKLFPKNKNGRRAKRSAANMFVRKNAKIVQSKIDTKKKFINFGESVYKQNDKLRAKGDHDGARALSKFTQRVIKKFDKAETRRVKRKK